MDQAEFKRQEAELKRKRRGTTLGATALAWLAMGGLQTVVALVLRNQSDPSNASGDLTERLQLVDWRVGPIITTVVAVAVGFRVYSDLLITKGHMVGSAPEMRPVDWKWSFWVPIGIGLVIFTILYNAVLD